MQKSKRSQLTIFIIIAILIIAGVVLFFTFREGIGKKEVVSPEIAPIRNFVEECIYDTGENAVFDLAKKGGYNDAENITNSGITYYILDGKNYMPSKEQLENEISDYVNRKFFLCSLNFADFPDYEIEQGNFETSSEILNNKVILDINYPLIIKKGESISRLENFHTEVWVRFGVVYDVISNFIAQDINSQGACITCLTEVTKEKNLEKDLYIGMNSTSEGVIFNFMDKKSRLNNQSLEWIFANKY